MAGAIARVKNTVRRRVWRDVAGKGVAVVWLSSDIRLTDAQWRAYGGVMRIDIRIPPEHQAALIALATAYAEAKGLSVPRVSTIARGHGDFFDRLARGRDCHVTTYRQMIMWFDERWPAETPWPDCIARPSAEREGVIV